MQKVQSYLYPNRHIVIADLAGFTVENTIVYAKTVKIYKGVDNVIQFDIQNADQKRLDLITTPLISGIQMNIMDIAGNALPSSPYDVVPHTTIKGIGIVTIPMMDLDDISHQKLQYSLTATDTSGNHIPLYTDSRFSAVGTIDIVGSAMPTVQEDKIYDRFSGEINYMGNVIYHTSVVATKSYRAIQQSQIRFVVYYTNFAGTLYIEGTEDSTISVDSFKHSEKMQTINLTQRTTGSTTFVVDIGDFNNLRVSWLYPDVWQYSATGQDPTIVYGSVDKVTVQYS
jgi:hypothetical protein